MRSALAIPLVLAVPSLASALELEVGEGQAFATIQAAVDDAAPGDVVRVHAGTYEEDLALSSSGTLEAPITVMAAGDGEAVVQGAVLIDGSDWRVEGLTFVAPLGGDAFRVRGDRIHLVGIDLSGGDRDGVDGSGSDNVVRDSRIHDFDGGDADAHCIVLNPGATRWLITGNELFDCSGDGVQLYADGAERTIVDTEISDNRIHWSGGIGRMENAIDVKNADGLLIFRNAAWGFVENKTMVFQKGPRAIAVQCNVLSDGFTGVEFRAEDGGTIEGVEFERNLMHGFTEYALKLDGTVGAEIVHNTFVDVASDGLRIEGLGLDGGVVRNNLWVRTGAIDAGSFEADHNGFFQVGTIGIASPSDVVADPLLDATFQLGAGSPMIDAGVDLGSTFVGAAPDLGWAEVGLEGCGAPGGEGGGGGGPGPSGSGGSGGSGGQSGEGAGPGAGGDGAGDAGAGAAAPGSVTGAGGGATGDGASADAGGCDCRVGGAARGPASAPAAALLAAIAIAWCRRRRG